MIENINIVKFNYFRMENLSEQSVDVSSNGKHSEVICKLFFAYLICTISESKCVHLLYWPWIYIA